MDPARPLAAIAALVALLAVASPAAARPRDLDAGNVTPLEQAREAARIDDAPRVRHDLPAGVLRLSRSELLAAHGQQLEISVTLDRAVEQGALELTLPSRWVGRSGVSDLRYARVPQAGRAAGSGARASRSGQVVRFAFSAAAKGASASLRITDVGIPPGRYELPYRWSGAGGAGAGTARVIFYAPVREEGEGTGDDWRALLRDVNATANGFEESETFLAVVPGNPLRYLVGANSITGGGFNAWITNNGGTSFTKAAVSATLDAPGEAGAEGADLCCDPMAAADAAGNLWYGGLSLANGPGNPSRIFVTRAAAPAATSFGAVTVGLRNRTGDDQDKPMMTIDNAPTSPTFGRLYVVWNEHNGPDVNIVMSQCDTRPNVANCDNADNWSTPVPVTPSGGGYIYADVAVGPDGRVYVVWWDYSSTNAIRGDVCAPASQNCASAAGWGTPQTIATLDDTGGEPVPFSCPIVAQPGGRASTSPQVDVDRSGGPNNGRVYVTWSDLRPGSGSTRCAVDAGSPDGNGLPPALTHLTWDDFVASAAGALPGGASSSPSVATRLLTDGEGGGLANSDDWFAWLAVDQTNGLAWADFYSTRDDPTRRTTQFYTRAVAPTAEGHALGPLRRVSTAPSDRSTGTCCTFGNDYGDYTGIDATAGLAFPVWSDRRGGLDGEAYVDTVQSALLVAGTRTIDDSPAAGGDGDGVLERGESVRLDQALRNVGTAAATGVSAAISGPSGAGVTATGSSSYSDIAIGATQTSAAPLTARMAADAPCGAPVPLSLQVTIAGGSAVVPLAPIPTGCPPPPPPPPPPVPPPPPPPPPPAAADTTIVFALTARSPQKPPTATRGIVVTLSCPFEDCRVAVRGTLTIPARTRAAATRRFALSSSTVQVTKARARRHTLRLSATLRRQIARALLSARTRTGVRVLVTATARDGAGNTSKKTKTVRVRR